MALLRRNYLMIVIERRLQRVPGKSGALHANRKLAHAAEDGQLAEHLSRVLASIRAGDEVMKLLEHRTDLALRFSLNAGGHERSRSGASGAPACPEAPLGDGL